MPSPITVGRRSMLGTLLGPVAATLQIAVANGLQHFLGLIGRQRLRRARGYVARALCRLIRGAVARSAVLVGLLLLLRLLFIGL
jgi:hypothetical protein